MKPDVVRYPIVSLDAFVTKFHDVQNGIIAAQIISHDDRIDPKAEMLDAYSHTYYEDFRLPDTDEIKDLKKRIVETVEDITGKPYRMTESWSIILEPGQSISFHNHHVGQVAEPNEYFAFAYYPFAPEGSCDLQFLATHSNVVTSTVTVPVSTGTLIIFNSYLYHWTHGQGGASARVNVSGNLVPANPTVTSHDDWSHYEEANNA